MAPVKVVVFDIIETVFSLEPVRHGLASAGFDPLDLETWFAFGLRDAFALNATGDFVPFKEVLDEALEQLAAIRGLSPGRDPVDHGAADAAERRCRDLSGATGSRPADPRFVPWCGIGDG